MREGELLGLKSSDLDPDANRLTVNHALAHTKRKKAEKGARAEVCTQSEAGGHATTSFVRFHADKNADKKGFSSQQQAAKSFLLSGERGRNRTFNLLIKSQLLCQLSYAPLCFTFKNLGTFADRKPFPGVVEIVVTTDRSPRFDRFNISSLSKALSIDSGDG
jgi:hypothetical protein